MVIRVAVPSPYCSATRGIRARTVVESLLGLPWNRRSLCCGIRARFAVESAFDLAWNTHIAIRISEKIGGIPSLTAVLVVMTGITGAIIAIPLLKLLRVQRPEIVGLAMGIAGHGIATARALQISEEAGAFAGLAMCLNGVLTACFVPLLYPMLTR